MTKKRLKTADAIIAALKDADSFDEAHKALEQVGRLPQTEKQSFANRLSSGDLMKEFIQAATKSRNSGFQIMFIEALHDIATTPKPEFRIIAKSPPPKR